MIFKINWPIINDGTKEENTFKIVLFHLRQSQTFKLAPAPAKMSRFRLCNSGKQTLLQSQWQQWQTYIITGPVTRRF